MHNSTLSNVLSNLNEEFGDLRRELFADMLAWINDGGEAEDYPGAGWDDPEADRFEPSALEEAELLGFEWGRDGGGRPEITDLSIPLAVHEARRRGYLEGRRAFIRAEAEYEDMLEARALEAELAERYAGSYWHANEVVESIGAVEMRKG